MGLQKIPLVLGLHVELTAACSQHYNWPELVSRQRCPLYGAGLSKFEMFPDFKDQSIV